MSIILTRTPFRITFFGGGSDYPDYFKRYGGKTLGAAISQYAYVVLRKIPHLDPYKYRLIYSQSELCQEISEIKQPVIRECLKEENMDEPLEIHYLADLPSLTGLGTSSSFSVGLLKALTQLKKQASSQTELAKKAIHVERVRLAERGGIQDQYTAAFGGVLKLNIQQSGEVQTQKLALSEKRLENLENHLLLLYTGVSRFSHEVLKEQVEKTKQGDLDSCLHEMVSLVDEGEKILFSNQDLLEFGKLLHHSWELKRKLSTQITTSTIDLAYQNALKHGALGGKLIGAGGGGFLLLFVNPDQRSDVRQALSDFHEVPVHFDLKGTVRLEFKEN